MKVVHLLRKPCSEGTVAANVLRWGTGALNIDACRVPGIPPSVPQPDFRKVNGRATSLDAHARNGEMSHATGRWPANLVLQHLDGCVQDGTRKVATARWRDTDTPHNPDSPTGNFGAGSVTGRHYGKDGTETVAAWNCALGCPVAGLDAQSGPTGSWSSQHRLAGELKQGDLFGTRREGTHYGDYGGGASRFFKQVGGATKTSTDG